MRNTVMQQRTETCISSVYCVQLVMLPDDFPMFVRPRRLHDELVALELVNTRQFLSNECAHQRSLHVERKCVILLVDHIAAILIGLLYLWAFTVTTYECHYN